MKKTKKKQLANWILLIEFVTVIALLAIVIRLMYKQLYDHKINAMSTSTVQTTAIDDTDNFEENTSLSLAESLAEAGEIYSHSSEDNTVTDVTHHNGYMGNTVADNELNIVVMGDSIWDHDRDDENTGTLLETYLQEEFPEQTVHVYNLAIGGTSAALSSDASTDIEGWDNKNISGVTYALTGKVEDISYLEGQAMYDILPEVNLDKIDYFIISYGLNDYFCGYPVTLFYRYDLHSYVGAIEDSINTLHNYCPEARFLVMSPTYCQFYYYDQVSATCLDRYFGEGGTLDKYAGGSAVVSLEFGTLYQDAFNDYGLGADTQSIYSKDGIHFNNEGRKVYARQVADCISGDYADFYNMTSFG